MLETRNKAELKSVEPQNLLQPDAIADVVLYFSHDDRLASRWLKSAHRDHGSCLASNCGPALAIS